MGGGEGDGSAHVCRFECAEEGKYAVRVRLGEQVVQEFHVQIREVRTRAHIQRMHPLTLASVHNNTLLCRHREERMLLCSICFFFFCLLCYHLPRT